MTHPPASHTVGSPVKFAGRSTLKAVSVRFVVSKSLQRMTNARYEQLSRLSPEIEARLNNSFEIELWRGLRAEREYSGLVEVSEANLNQLRQETEIRQDGRIEELEESLAIRTEELKDKVTLRDHNKELLAEVKQLEYEARWSEDG
jgi:hypothetical protein